MNQMTVFIRRIARVVATLVVMVMRASLSGCVGNELAAPPGDGRRRPLARPGEEGV